MPSQANDRDPQPYIYATDMACETLPYATPNGTRIFNVTIPERNMTITLIPDREKFLEQGVMQGTLYELPIDGFSKSPHHETQYISPKPIAFKDMKKVAEINNIEDAMAQGLHILFTDEPLTEKNYAEMFEPIMNDPEFPDNLRYYVDQGIFTYENECRGIGADPYLSSTAHLSRATDNDFKMDAPASPKAIPPKL